MSAGSTCETIPILGLSHCYSSRTPVVNFINKAVPKQLKLSNNSLCHFN